MLELFAEKLHSMLINPHALVACGGTVYLYTRDCELIAFNLASKNLIESTVYNKSTV